MINSLKNFTIILQPLYKYEMIKMHKTKRKTKTSSHTVFKITGPKKTG
jgi:hypothetical protein